MSVATPQVDAFIDALRLFLHRQLVGRAGEPGRAL
jgi:hypothetical protein